MGEHVLRMPDVGEGVAEAEIVSWQVSVGQEVEVDQPLADVMTDKATIEVPSPVAGTVLSLGGEPGDVIAVGAELIRISVVGVGNAASGAAATAPQPAAAQPVAAAPLAKLAPEPDDDDGDGDGSIVASDAGRRSGRVVASPAVRARAADARIDLGAVRGSGPAGRVSQRDLDAWMDAPSPRGARERQDDSVSEVKVIGLRRQIAKQMALSKQHIPHITYVEEIDVTRLESLRSTLNASRRADRPKLTFLPFLMRAVVLAAAAHPTLNARFDDDAGVLTQYAGVHIGVATQTDAGLLVPVVRHAQTLDVWESAAEVQRLASACRAGTATREQLTGSTITISSLGALGGIVTTPVINYPEVAIVGVNKVQVRPMWDGAGFVPRSMMNLSSGFDHRIVDGWLAAEFVQHIKSLVEEPALLFIEGS